MAGRVFRARLVQSREQAKPRAVPFRLELLLPTLAAVLSHPGAGEEGPFGRVQLPAVRGDRCRKVRTQRVCKKIQNLFVVFLLQSGALLL